MLAQALRDATISNAETLFEPYPRNTAPAIAAAAIHLSAHLGDDAQMLIMPADHAVRNNDAFAAAVVAAQELACQDRLVAFGIVPHHPATGYGYIEAAGETIMRFVEKPDAQTATMFLAESRMGRAFYWNSGIYCFTVATILRALEMYCADILVAARRAYAAAERFAGGILLDGDSFAHAQAQSIDYAVMEKVRDAAVVACDIGWHDIGSWDGVDVLGVPDADGNRLFMRSEADADKVVTYNVRDTTILSDSRTVGVVGVKGLAIIDTPDALLVADKAASQDVRTLYETLVERGDPTHSAPAYERRPWGSFEVLEVADGYKVKRLEVVAGARLSLQAHAHRDEHWVVVAGRAEIINGALNDGKPFILERNQATHIAAGDKHRLHNPGTERLVLIEVQIGDYLGEDDIHRFADDYSRQSNEKG